MAAEDETIAIRAVVHGRVQGVWFRAWTAEQAEALGLRGWVRNRPDGTVEAQFAGPAPAVRRMMELCREGPPQARVERIDEERAFDDGNTGFRQLPTG